MSPIIARDDRPYYYPNGEESGVAAAISWLLTHIWRQLVRVAFTADGRWPLDPHQVGPGDELSERLGKLVNLPALQKLGYDLRLQGFEFGLVGSGAGALDQVLPDGFGAGAVGHLLEVRTREAPFGRL